MHFFFIILLIFIFLPPLQAQKQANFWSFGKNISLDFNDDPPEVGYSPLSTDEGISSVSDFNGNKLFFTDGRKVYNKDHKVMANGNGLMSHQSASQAALIVPLPGNCSIYYVFTVDAVENKLANGLRYSIVDMSLQGGLGEVTKKNILLYTPTTEKLTATTHKNGKDLWIISHKWESDEFVAYLLTASGLVLTPIVSKIGTVHRGGYNNIGNAIGYMKTSPSGHKLALAICNMERFELFDFDTSTGQVSNFVPLPIPVDQPFMEYYGVEFSPDGNLLYASLGNGAFRYNRICQFNLLLSSKEAILNSKVEIESSTFRKYAAMQLGPDNKIYVTSTYSDDICAITQPNIIGKGCDFKQQIIKFYSDAPLRGGLPNFPSGYFHSPISGVNEPPLLNLGNDTTLCPEQSLLLDPKIENVSYLWQDGSTTNSYLVTKPGKYVLTLSNACGYKQDTINVQYISLPKLDLGANQVICGTSTILTASDGYESYKWSNGATSQSILVSTAGKYSVEGSLNGCTQISNAIEVTFVSLPDLSLGENKLICDDESILLEATEGYDSYHWNNGNSSNKIVVDIPGLYIVQANKGNCLVLDSVYVDWQDCPKFIPNVITPNGDGANDTFEIKGIKKNWKLTIYNRLGKLVYEQDQYMHDWNGEGLLNGTYYYQLQHPKKLRIYKGWISILR